MSNKSSNDSGANGIGCSLALIATVVLVILKLAGVISWSWWLVFSPVPLLIAIGIGYLLIMLILAALGIGTVAGVAGIGSLIQKRLNKKRREALLEERRFEAAGSLGRFNTKGDKVESRKPHSWML
jgi:hypothetical protein